MPIFCTSGTDNAPRQTPIQQLKEDLKGFTSELLLDHDPDLDISGGFSLDIAWRRHPCPQGFHWPPLQGGQGGPGPPGKSPAPPWRGRLAEASIGKHTVKWKLSAAGAKIWGFWPPLAKSGMKTLLVPIPVHRGSPDPSSDPGSTRATPTSSSRTPAHSALVPHCSIGDIRLELRGV